MTWCLAPSTTVLVTSFKNYISLFSLLLFLIFSVWISESVDIDPAEKRVLSYLFILLDYFLHSGKIKMKHNKIINPTCMKRINIYLSEQQTVTSTEQKQP